MEDKDVDVLIVGAGIVGLTLALGFAEQGLEILLIDKAKAPKKVSKDTFSPRVSAISSSSQALLERLGAWSLIERKQAYANMDVWDKDGFGHISFSASEIKTNSNSLGHIIENDVLNLALYEKLQSYPKVKLCFESSFSDVSSSKDCASAVLKEGAHKALKVKARLLVGADGANSKVREHFGFTHAFSDYDHSAIVANVRTQTPHANTARQAFTPFGPLAFLPLPDAYLSSFVFSQQSGQAEKLMAMTEDKFLKTLQVSIDNHYGACELVTKRFSFPLRMRYAKKWTCEHVAIIGDAAHTIHPLAGQGANLGLGDVNTLLTLVKDKPSKLGESILLRKYERARKAEAVKTIATMQGFKSLFDGEQAPKKLIRNLGLLGADKLPGIKAFFIRQAMGA